MTKKKYQPLLRRPVKGAIHVNNAHKRGRINHYKGMGNVRTRLAPTPPPDDAYAPWLDGTEPAKKYSTYRKLEEQVVPADQRMYYGRRKGA